MIFDAKAHAAPTNSSPDELAEIGKLHACTLDGSALRRVCPECKEVFVPVKSWQIFDCDLCRFQFHNRRRRYDKEKARCGQAAGSKKITKYKKDDAKNATKK